MPKHLTTHLTRGKDPFAPAPRLTGTAPRLAGTFLNLANNDPARAIQFARILVVGKAAQQAVIAAIATVLLRAEA